MQTSAVDAAAPATSLPVPGPGPVSDLVAGATSFADLLDRALGGASTPSTGSLSSSGDDSKTGSAKPAHLKAEDSSAQSADLLARMAGVAQSVTQAVAVLIDGGSPSAASDPAANSAVSRISSATPSSATGPTGSVSSQNPASAQPVASDSASSQPTNLKLTAPANVLGADLTVNPGVASPSGVGSTVGSSTGSSNDVTSNAPIPVNPDSKTNGVASSGASADPSAAEVPSPSVAASGVGPTSSDNVSPPGDSSAVVANRPPASAANLPAVAANQLPATSTTASAAAPPRSPVSASTTTPATTSADQLRLAELMSALGGVTISVRDADPASRPAPSAPPATVPVADAAIATSSLTPDSASAIFAPPASDPSALASAASLASPPSVSPSPAVGSPGDPIAVAPSAAIPVTASVTRPMTSERGSSNGAIGATAFSAATSGSAPQTASSGNGSSSDSPSDSSSGQTATASTAVAPAGSAPTTAFAPALAGGVAAANGQLQATAAATISATAPIQPGLTVPTVSRIGVAATASPTLPTEVTVATGAVATTNLAPLTAGPARDRPTAASSTDTSGVTIAGPTGAPVVHENGVVTGPVNAANASPVPSRLLDQIASQAHLAFDQGHHEVQLQLHPDALGQLNVRLTFDSGAVTVHLGAENSDVGNLLQANLGQLKNAFENQGIRADQFVVFVGQGSTPDLNQGRQEQPTADSGPSRRVGSVSAASSPNLPEPVGWAGVQRSSGSGTSSVDLRA